MSLSLTLAIYIYAKVAGSYSDLSRIKGGKMGDNGHSNELTPQVIKALDLVKALNPEERRQFYQADLSYPEPEEITDPWKPFTLADAYQPRPAVEYIAAGMFALPSLNIVYGSPGTLKSFWLADLMVCVAAGEAWLPPAPWIVDNAAKSIITHKSPTMWADFDNGRRRTHDRFAALGRARNLPADSDLIYYSMPAPWLDASDKASIGALASRMLSHGTKLLVVDNLGVVTGDAEENSGEMASIMSLFRQTAEETGAAIVLIHHQRKSNGMTGRAGDSLRGHSSIEAALDLALLVEREDYSDTITIKATKTRGEDVLPFSAAFTYDNNQQGEMNTARFFGIATEDLKSTGAIEQAIIGSLTDKMLNKSNLAKDVKMLLPDVGINRIRDVIDRMASLNKIKGSPGKNNTERVFTL